MQVEMASKWIVVGRFITTGTFSSSRLFQRMREIWHLRGGMEYKELAGSRFLIEFEQEGDFLHVLTGGPWTYLGDALLVVAYDGVSSVADIDIHILPIWVRIFDLPVPMLNATAGREVGELLGPVRMVHTDNRGKAWDNFLHVRIEHDIYRPIESVVRIQDKMGRNFKRYDVKYERIPRFCFYCGIVGHCYSSCLIPEEDKKVRFCEDQIASPYKKFDHRSFYLPGEQSRAKKQLYLPSRDMLGRWKGDGRSAAPEEGKDGGLRTQNTAHAVPTASPVSADRNVTDPVVADALNGVSDAVGKLTVTGHTLDSQGEKEAVPKETTPAAKPKGKTSSRRRTKTDGQKGTHIKAARTEQNVEKIGRLEGSESKMQNERVARQKALQVLKDKIQLLGKRRLEEYMEGKEVEDEAQKKIKHAPAVLAAGQGEGNEGIRQTEATSHGATGELTGAKESARQEQ